MIHDTFSICNLHTPSNSHDLSSLLNVIIYPTNHTVLPSHYPLPTLPIPVPSLV